MRCHTFLALAVLAPATLSGCSRGTSDSGSPGRTILPVRAIETKTQSGFSYSVSFYGRIKSARRTALAFEIPGQITRVLVDEGDVIEVGQPVARLNTSILQAQRKSLLARKLVEQAILRRLEKGERKEVIAAARAVVSQMEAELEEARRKSDRLERIRNQKAVSESEYEAALFRAKSLQASLDAAKARLRELTTGTREEDLEAQTNRLAELDAQVAVVDARIEKAVLSAPYSGHVVKRVVDEGSVIQEGEPVLLLTEANRHEARFSLPVGQLEEAKLPSTIHVAGIKVTTTNVRTISSVDPMTRTVDVVYTLTSGSPVLEGQTCTLRLLKRVHTPCMELPLSALVPSVRGLWSCYRLQRDEGKDTYRLHREEVTINHTVGDRAFVETSLPDGSLVVSEGAHKLVPGMLVRLEDSDP